MTRHQDGDNLPKGRLMNRVVIRLTARDEQNIEKLQILVPGISRSEVVRSALRLACLHAQVPFVMCRETNSRDPAQARPQADISESKHSALQVRVDQQMLVELAQLSDSRPTSATTSVVIRDALTLLLNTLQLMEYGWQPVGPDRDTIDVLNHLQLQLRQRAIVAWFDTRPLRRQKANN